MSNKLYSLLLLIMLSGVSGELFAQNISKSVTAAAGNQLANGQFQLSWTLGEMAIENLGNNKLSQGFQQATVEFQPVQNFQLASTNKQKSKHTDWAVAAYPNPFTHVINLKKPNDRHIKSIRVINGAGQLVLSLNPKDNTIEAQSWSPGNYFLEIIDDQSNRHLLKVQKIQ